MRSITASLEAVLADGGILRVPNLINVNGRVLIELPEVARYSLMS